MLFTCNLTFGEKLNSAPAHVGITRRLYPEAARLTAPHAETAFAEQEAFRRAQGYVFISSDLSDALLFAY